ISGLGFAAGGVFSEGAAPEAAPSGAPLAARAAASISATLKRPPPGAVAGLIGSKGAAGVAGVAAAGGAGSPLGGVAAAGAPAAGLAVPPPSTARAAASISATVSFFLSAMGGAFEEALPRPPLSCGRQIVRRRRLEKAAPTAEARVGEKAEKAPPKQVSAH